MTDLNMFSQDLTHAAEVLEQSGQEACCWVAKVDIVNQIHYMYMYNYVHILCIYIYMYICIYILSRLINILCCVAYVLY